MDVVRIRFRWNPDGNLGPSNISGDLSDFNRVVRIFRTTPLRRKRQRQSRRRIRMQAFGETSHHQRTSGESLLQSRLAERAVQTRSIISLIFPNLAEIGLDGQTLLEAVLKSGTSLKT